MFVLIRWKVTISNPLGFEVVLDVASDSLQLLVLGRLPTRQRGSGRFGILQTPSDALLELGPEGLDATFVDDMRVMPEVEWDVVGSLRQQHDRLRETVRIAGLVEDVRVPIRHLSDNQVGALDLSVNALEDVLEEDLLVDSRARSARRLACRRHSPHAEQPVCCGRGPLEFEWAVVACLVRRSGRSAVVHGVPASLASRQTKRRAS